MQSYYAYFDPDEEEKQPIDQPTVSTYQLEQPLPEIDSGLADSIIQMLNESKKKQKQASTPPAVQ